MSLYEQYNDEADFRQRFIKPLLNRMGFSGVAETHGPREFGADFLFAELTRFGIHKHYAAVVKHEETINQGKSVDKVISQIGDAFTASHTTADSKAVRHVSAVYVFNSGGITDNAKDRIINELNLVKYGANVHCFDGDKLDQLNKFVTFKSDEDTRQRLQALYSSLVFNQLIIDKHITNVQELINGETVHEGSQLFLNAIESYIVHPVPFDDELLTKLQAIWQFSKIVTSIRQALLRPMLNGDVHKKQIEILKTELDMAKNRCDYCRITVAKMLEKIPSFID